MYWDRSKIVNVQSKETKEAREKGADDLGSNGRNIEIELHDEPPFRMTDDRRRKTGSIAVFGPQSSVLKQKNSSPFRDEEHSAVPP